MVDRLAALHRGAAPTQQKGDLPTQQVNGVPTLQQSGCPAMPRRRQQCARSQVRADDRPDLHRCASVGCSRAGPTLHSRYQALEDLSVAYDATVLNASGGIVQMWYGDDGMDPAHMEGSDGGALNLDRTFTTCQVGGGV
ncbi:unnamed protein product [Closterium sp. NIES-54]